MQQHNNTDPPTAANNTTKMSPPQVWERRLSIFNIILALIGLLVCIGSLIQGYVTHEEAFELLVNNFLRPKLVDSFFKPGLELLGYYSSVLYIASYLTLIIALNIPTIVGVERKQLSYVSAFVGAILMFASFGLSSISCKPGWQQWWNFSMIALGTGVVAVTFFQLTNREQKRLRSILRVIIILFYLAYFILLCFANFKGATTIASMQIFE